MDKPAIRLLFRDQRVELARAQIARDLCIPAGVIERTEPFKRVRALVGRQGLHPRLDVVAFAHGEVIT